MTTGNLTPEEEQLQRAARDFAQAPIGEWTGYGENEDNPVYSTQYLIGVQNGRAVIAEVQLLLSGNGPVIKAHIQRRSGYVRSSFHGVRAQEWHLDPEKAAALFRRFTDAVDGSSVTLVSGS